MSILDPWAGEGSLGAAEVVDVASAEREGWAALRSLQGDPTADVLRYTVSGADPARGISGTKTLTSGLDDVPVLYGDLTIREAEERGIEYADGMSRFEFFTDVEVVDTDLLRYPATSGKVYRVVATNYDSHIGQCVVYTKPAPVEDPGG